MTVINQKISDEYAVYNGDCMDVVRELGDKSVDLSIYSPPFAGLYQYSSDPRDMSNCESKEKFLENYEYLVKEMGRVTKDGRINAIHCADTFNAQGMLWDFPHEVISLHEKYGFKYASRITIWKEPLKIRLRTMVQSLMHKFIVEDSCKCYPSMPDYVLIFIKKGKNEVPVNHPCGITEYYGEVPILPNMIQAYNNANGTNYDSVELWNRLKQIADDNEGKITKLNHYIWQRYASSVWDDIRNENVLPFRKSKDKDDEKHVHPLQLDVIARLVELYSNKGEIVFTPFMGVGSEVYQSVKMGRKGIGVELKKSYYKQTLLNLDSIKNDIGVDGIDLSNKLV